LWGRSWRGAFRKRLRASLISLDDQKKKKLSREAVGILKQLRIRSRLVKGTRAKKLGVRQKKDEKGKNLEGPSAAWGAGPGIGHLKEVTNL